MRNSLSLFLLPPVDMNDWLDCSLFLTDPRCGIRALPGEDFRSFNFLIACPTGNKILNIPLILLDFLSL